MHFPIKIFIAFLVGCANVKYSVADCDVPPNIPHATVELTDDSEVTTATYTCHDGYYVVGEHQIYCELITNKWTSAPPKCESNRATSGESNSGERNGKRRKEISEDRSIDENFAQQLDITCLGSVKAPELENAFAKYSRLRKGEKMFLVAYYSCEDGYELESIDSNRLYCSQQSWITVPGSDRPNCLSIEPENDEDEDDGDDEEGDYDDEDVEEGDEEEEEENGEEEEIETNGRQERNDVNGETDDTYESKKHLYKENEIDYERNRQTTEAAMSLTTRNDHSTEPPTISLTNPCNEGRGGCEHECQPKLSETGDSYLIQCTCFAGFILGDDGRTCQDINECDVENAGCEQICINKPGSFECGCNSGLQIDSIDFKSCVDINECLLRNGHGPCQDTCHNTWTGYYCTCDDLPGTQLSVDGHHCEDSGDCRIDNGGCQHKCLTQLGRKYCLCDAGYILADNWRDCNDIDECQDPTISGQCPMGCENLPGTYRCKASDNEESNLIPPPSCGSGLTATTGGECVDIDECLSEDHGCENCLNTFGGFECTCPSGYELNDDERTCRDINECEEYAEYSSEDPNHLNRNTICSHQCVNTAGSFRCICPDDYHLLDDQRMCVRDYCADLTNPDLNKSRCSHDCVDGADGFICQCPRDWILSTDFKNCQQLTSGCQIDADHCSPGKCLSLPDGRFKCDCPTGYIEQSTKCRDLDECEIGHHDCSHRCENYPGSFRCTCPDGLKLSDYDNRTCEDINECESNICGSLACENSFGGYSCKCQEGHTEQPDGTCQLTDPCRINNGGCADRCTILMDGRVECHCLDEEFELAPDGRQCVRKTFEDVCERSECSQLCDPNRSTPCYCQSGYQLDSDDRTCIDWNECVENNGDCEHYCTNKDGSYECSCAEGYAPYVDQPNKCQILNRCQENNGNCDHDCEYLDSEKTTRCSCRLGFELNQNDQRSCIDINECLVNNGNCSDICQNNDGSHTCLCPESSHLRLDQQTCESDDQCQINNGGCSHTCRFDRGQAYCECPPGYELDVDGKTCQDIDECRTNNGQCTQICVNRQGYYQCECRSGYELSDRFNCVDIDECIESNGNCSNICVNLPGSHYCTCETGFELTHDKRTCIDIDECVDDIHDCSHECINTAGTYDCHCPSGFRLGRDRLTCEDINECSLLNLTCPCVNTIGSFHCSCRSGFKTSPNNQTCIDIDECQTEKICSHTCQNTEGSFNCMCPDGLKLSVDLVTCIDIDECESIHLNNCSDHCVNTFGSYHCSCPTGYQLSNNQCVDIDECASSNCSQLCINLNGSFHCACHTGFILNTDGHHCDPFDLCQEKNGGCDQICQTINGRPHCSCFKGFQFERKLNHLNHSCRDVDECRTMKNRCEHKCVNTIGSYRCDCPKGYAADEYGRCVDINECLLFNVCPKRAECLNLPGSYSCSCPNGYELSTTNYKTCVAIAIKEDACPNIKEPENGRIYCVRKPFTVKGKLFYRTKCTVQCYPDYRLEGPSVHHCNSTHGWDNITSLCLPVSCGVIPVPQFGRIVPDKCTRGPVKMGQRCTLQCQTGYRPRHRQTTICDENTNWIPTANLECVQETDGDQQQIKPFIKCPRDTTIILPKTHRMAHIKLEQPETNVNWRKMVDSYPAWGKKLQARLVPGMHTVTFRARSPTINTNAVCRTVITVKESQPPLVTYCPETTEIQFVPHEVARKIYWKEPTFETHGHLKQIFKSNIPGESMGPGAHRITYVATDQYNETSRCEFLINIKSYQLSAPAPYISTNRQSQSAHRFSRLENHESYLMCPGRPAMKIETNYPLQLPPNCIVKNVRLPYYNHHRRRDNLTQNNNMLRHYSSWDNHPYRTHHERRQNIQSFHSWK